MRSSVEKEIFAYETPYTQLNFPESGGVTGYFSRNIVGADLDLTKRFLKSEQCIARGLDILNTRVFKRAENDYILTVASASEKECCSVQFEGNSFELRFGEFSAYLEECKGYLEKALQFVANDEQRVMVEKYIESFHTGSITAHKDSQRAWVKDKSPVVECNLGWIETY